MLLKCFIIAIFYSYLKTPNTDMKRELDLCPFSFAFISKVYGITAA